MVQAASSPNANSFPVEANWIASSIRLCSSSKQYRSNSLSSAVHSLHALALDIVSMLLLFDLAKMTQ